MLKLVLSGEYAVLDHMQVFESLALASHKDAPLHKMNEQWQEVVPFFRASFRIQAKPKGQRDGPYDYGTGFALSKTKVASALHLRFTQGGGRICAWRGMYGAVTQELFESNKLPRFHLKELGVCMSRHEPEMIDPVTHSTYDLQHFNRVDVGIWELELNSKKTTEYFESPKGPVILKKFSQVLIPMSLTMEVGYK
ncbi:hypothetical protein GOP47_0028785 [Adiantum capillus-veneris]|nr:hypothetical protein GOP47_0028785 [Adiantum capillus-veneris]